MSAFTDRLYGAWKRQNGSGRGVGAVAPTSAQWLADALRLPRGAVARAGAAFDARSIQQKKKAPASVSSTPGAATNIGANNVDVPDCRP
jgi:hypothetical protein